MARLSAAGQAAANNGVAATIGAVVLVTTDPTTTGGTESGARQTIAWTTGTAGTPGVSNTAQISHPAAASTTYNFSSGHVNTTVTAGDYRLGFTLSPVVTTGSAGTITVAAGQYTIGSS